MEDTFLNQHDSVPVHKARSIKNRFSQLGVEELDWPALGFGDNALLSVGVPVHPKGVG